MKNIGKLEQIFLSHYGNCPYCDSELSSTLVSRNYVDGSKAEIYRYGCGCDIRLDYERENEDKSRLTLLETCKAKTTSLFFVLDLHYQLEQKQNNK